MEASELEENKYENNSYKSKLRASSNEPAPAKKEVRPVASGKEKKKTLSEQFVDNFIAASGEDIKRSLIFDFLIPGAKDAIEAIVHMLLHGNTGSSSSFNRNRSESRLRRVDIYKNSSSNEPVLSTRISREPEITYETKDQANRVLYELRELIRTYNRVTVKELYDLSNLRVDFAASNWGWRYLPDNLEPFQVRGGGWCLKMPRTEEMR